MRGCPRVMNIFVKIILDLISWKNLLANASQPTYFHKWKITSFFWKMEGNLNVWIMEHDLSF